jgi:large subunit ribosomal protein L48
LSVRTKFKENETTSESNTKPTIKKVKLSEYLKHFDADKQDELKSKIKIDELTNKEVKYYDPPYLIRKAPFPNYELLNLNFKGYEYSALDVFYQFVERLCKALQVEVVEAYPMPARSIKVKTYQPFSTNLDKEYSLQMYHRVVRIRNLESTVAPTLLESIQLNLPEGVQMNVSVPSEEEDEFRYVPDIELNELKQRLEEMNKKPKGEEDAAVRK